MNLLNLSASVFFGLCAGASIVYFVGLKNVLTSRIRIAVVLSVILLATITSFTFIYTHPEPLSQSAKPAINLELLLQYTKPFKNLEARIRVASILGIVLCVIIGYAVFCDVIAWWLTKKLYGRPIFQLAIRMSVFAFRSRLQYSLLLAPLGLIFMTIFSFGIWPLSLTLSMALLTVHFYACHALPPAILFLSTSRKESAKTIYRLTKSLHPFRTVALLDPKTTLPEKWSSFKRGHFEWNNLRTLDHNWRETVMPLMENVPYIIIDGDVATDAVLEETRQITLAGFLSKTLFITYNQGDSQVVEEVCKIHNGHVPKCFEVREVISYLKQHEFRYTIHSDPMDGI